MTTKIITISREFGSGGRFIGEMLAKELGFSFYDKELIARVAEKTGFSEKFIENRREYALKNSIFSYSFVGRCADFILKAREDVLNIFIHSNETEKCKRIMDLYQKNKKEALTLMKDTDKKRSINYAYYTDQTWGESRNYALCLNSGILGYDKCIKIIKEAFYE